MSLQETIIQELGVKPVIDAQEEIRRSIDFLKRYLKKHSLPKNLCTRDFWRTRLNLSRTIGSTGHGRTASRDRGMIATNLSLSACLMECKLMKQMLKKP